MTLIGLDRQQGELLAALNGRMHHAWLLAGPKGVGKASFAKAAAQALLQGPPWRFDDPDPRTAALIAAHSHPDYRLIEREVWDKSNPPRVVPYDMRKGDDAPARSIRIAQIRALEPMLAMAPSLSARRVVVIDAADDLETSGANALLKMLEEPPAHTVFLLVSHAPGRLLPTIRSRCRVLRFDPLPDAVVADTLADVAPDERRAAVAAAGGSIGRARQLAAVGIGEIEAALTQLAHTGDRDNAIRSKLSKTLGVKAAAARYLAFLDLAPAFIAEQARGQDGEALAAALDAWSEARHVAAIAVPQSLVAETVVFELAGKVARLGSPSP